MKNFNKLIFILFGLIWFNQTSVAQQCWNTINTTTTDWRVSGSPNTWNWTQQGVTHPVYLSDNMNSPSFYVELPYFCGGGIGSGGCGNLNTEQYHYISAANQDIKPEDGWELIVKNFGTQNSTTTSNDGRKVDNPFFVLYNKHTGKMKIYYAITESVSANSSYLSIHFAKDKLKRALFAHALPVANTLIEFNPKLDFNTFNRYENSSTYYWMVAEIQTAYDPCTCSLNGLPSENSTIEILPFTTTTTTIDATIEGTATQQIANNGQVGATTDGKTAATSNGDVFKDIIAAGQAGLKGYTEWDGYKNQYDGMVNKWNDEYKNKLVKDWFDEYVKSHKQYQGITGLNDKLTLWNNLGKTDDEFKKSIGIKNLNGYEQNNDWYALKSIAGYLPYVGTAIGIIDFFVNGGSQAEPAKPSPPMVFNVSLKLKGTLTTSTSPNHFAFLNPGSPTLTAIPALYPYYNNILGVFNILKPPALKFGGINYTIPEGNFHFIDYSINQDLGLVNVTLTNQSDAQTESDIWKNKPIFKQFKLTEDVKYIVNPAAKVEVEMIDACFVLEYDNTPNLSISNHDFINIQNYPSYPFYNGLFNGSMSLSDRITNIQQTGLDLEYISADKSIVRFRTKYVPLTCLKNETFTLFNGASQPKVYINTKPLTSC